MCVKEKRTNRTRTQRRTTRKLWTRGKIHGRPRRKREKIAKKLLSFLEPKQKKAEIGLDTKKKERYNS